MKKKIISLIALLACASLVTACDKDESSASSGAAPSNDTESGYNYGDISGNGGNTSDSNNNNNQG